MPNYISGVFNYCNAWCKRCPFENQCRSAEMTREFERAAPLDAPPAAFPYVSGSFKDYWLRLDHILRAAGTSLEKEGYGLNEQHPKPVKIKKAKAKKIALEISLAVMDESDIPETPWLNQSHDFSTPLGQACTTFAWHGMMVGPKFGRLIDPEKFSSFSLNHHDNHDKAPTAKLNLIILTRSIAAATVIMEAAPETVKSLLPIVADLAKLLNYVRIHYPEAEHAVLPGFDDPTYQEQIDQFYGGFLPIDPIADNCWVIGERAPRE